MRNIISLFAAYDCIGGENRISYAAMKKEVFVIIPLAGVNASLMQTGIRRYARMEGWRLTFIDRKQRTIVGRMLRSSHPDGVIVEGCSVKPAKSASLPPSLFGETPVVYIDCDPSQFQTPIFCVSQNSFEAGRLAALELNDLGLNSFAYVPRNHPAYWDPPRLDGFRKTLVSLGAIETEDAVRVFRHADCRNPTWRDMLAEWLTELPKPTGLFAANDFAAYDTILAAERTGIGVPEGIAVIGVDNDRSICENATPGITSIEPDFIHAGVMAARMLAERMANPQMAPITRHFRATSVERRASTDMHTSVDPVVSRIRTLIRDKACEGLNACDAVASVNASRSYVERKFREVTGHTVLDEITDVRIERAKTLLRKSDIMVSAVADLCGWRSYSQMHRTFRVKCGMSPQAYRLFRQASQTNK